LRSLTDRNPSRSSKNSAPFSLTRSTCIKLTVHNSPSRRKRTRISGRFSLRSTSNPLSSRTEIRVLLSVISIGRKRELFVHPKKLFPKRRLREVARSKQSKKHRLSGFTDIFAAK